MLNRISRLFRRYVSQHGTIRTQGFPLKDVEGNVFGFLDAIEVKSSRFYVKGWCFAPSVGLFCAAHTDTQVPSLARPDVAAQFENPHYPTPGFELDVHCGEGHRAFWAVCDGERHFFEIDASRQTSFLWMRCKQIVPFTVALLRSLPSAIRWYRHRDYAARLRIKQILGFQDVVVSNLLNTHLFTSSQEGLQVATEQTEITIILPVYNAFDLLPDVLARVLSYTDLPYRLIIVEDKSTDVAVRPYLQKWQVDLPAKLKSQVEVLENEQNLGFIGSVNKAFGKALEYGNHVVLLNSDAFVPKEWASRLLDPIVEDSCVATVTPMSNDAEIFSVPVICTRSDLSGGVADRIDDVARALSPDAIFATAPTGVGFCMAMNIKYLKLEPEFDTVFGRGYGEEVDWCRRVVARGGRHLGHGGIFVEHRGGTSFGSEEKRRLVLANNQIVSQRHAGYDEMVQSFIRQDPLNSPRLALAFAWADAHAKQDRTGPVPVYLAHNMGGGADHYLAHKIESDLEQCAAIVVVRVGGVRRWKVEVHSAMGITCALVEDRDLLESLVGVLSSCRIIYSCGVGDRDPVALPGLLQTLAESSENRLEILMHDFFPLSPSYTLLDHDGVYRGVPDASNTNRAHRAQAADGTVVSLLDWRHAWGAAMRNADCITVFSKNSADLVLQAYPDIKNRVRVVPHTLLHNVQPIGSGTVDHAKPVIGVLGNIGLQKGARVLEALSVHLAETQTASLVVIGNLDPAFVLRAPAQVHGSYDLRDLPALVKKYGITDWLLPSIWPETFSYAIHEAIATELPVWSFDLGAQGDAARTAATRTGEGGVIALDLQSPDFKQMLDTMLNDAERMTQ